MHRIMALAITIGPAYHPGDGADCISDCGVNLALGCGVKQHSKCLGWILLRCHLWDKAHLVKKQGGEFNPSAICVVKFAP